MGSSKFTDDFHRAKEDRETVATNLNKHLLKHDLEFIRMHEYLKTMRIHEKVKFNNLYNRIGSSIFHRAMGLDYLLVRKGERKGIPFMFRFSNDSGFYIKLPKEYKETLESAKKFVQILIDLNYQILFIVRNNTELFDLYYGPVSLKNIFELSSYYLMSETKGNTNRLQFSYNPKSYVSIDRFDLFGDSILTRLIKLYDESVLSFMANGSDSRK